MSARGHKLRALVNERLSAAAEEIFALFERTIAEYEEELYRNKEDNQRKQEALDSDVHSPSSSPEPGLKDRSTSAPLIKEEPEEEKVKQETQQGSQSCGAFVKTEEPPLFAQTEHREDTQGEDINSELLLLSEQEDTELSSDNYEDWRRDLPMFLPPEVQPPTYMPAPETCTAGNPWNMLGTAEGSQRKKYQCVICKKRFRESHQLNIHLRIHTGEKPFSCSVCKKTFSQKSSLFTHRRSHTGERPYRCSFCEKAFFTSSDRTKHERIHTGVKPYSCPTCDKTFTLKGNLNAHMKTHTEERPYICSVCGKEYAYASALKRHLKTHAAGQSFTQGLHDNFFPVHI